MAKKSNRDIERYYFEMFRTNYQLPEGDIIYGDKPDVILEGKRIIGIEITNFFLESGSFPESEQVQRKAREAVVSKAQQIYLSDGGKRIEFSFSFDKASPIRNRGELAKKVAKVAKDVDKRKTGTISNDFLEDTPELSFAYLNATEYEDPKWRVVQCHSGQTMSMEKLRKIVCAKEKRSRSYQRCDTYWLVIVVDFIDSAQDQEIQIDDFEKINSEIFEKVIVYKTYFGQVFEAK